MDLDKQQNKNDEVEPEIVVQESTDKTGADTARTDAKEDDDQVLIGSECGDDVIELTELQKEKQQNQKKKKSTFAKARKSKKMKEIE